MISVPQCEDSLRGRTAGTQCKEQLQRSIPRIFFGPRTRRTEHSSGGQRENAQDERRLQCPDPHFTHHVHIPDPDSTQPSLSYDSQSPNRRSVNRTRCGNRMPRSVTRIRYKDPLQGFVTRIFERLRTPRRRSKTEEQFPGPRSRFQ